MNFDITKENIENLRELVSNSQKNEVEAILDELHAADIAELMDDLTVEEAKFIYLLLDGEKASDVLIEIPDNDRKRFLNLLSPEFIASKFIEHMDSDDAADI